MKTRKIVALVVLSILSGCDQTPPGKVVPTAYAPSSPQLVGRWKITYLGEVHIDGYDRTIIEIEDTKSGSVSIMIRGFGASEEFREYNPATKTNTTREK